DLRRELEPATRPALESPRSGWSGQGGCTRGALWPPKPPALGDAPAPAGAPLEDPTRVWRAALPRLEELLDLPLEQESGERGGLGAHGAASPAQLSASMNWRQRP